MSTLVELLRSRSELMPDATAFDFSAGGRRVDTLTYGQLESAARAAAGRIRAFCPPGQRVVLMHPPGLDFVVDLFGCFYAGAVAIPLPPPQRDDDRLAKLVDAASPAAVLTSGDDLSALERRLGPAGARPGVVSLPRGGDADFQPADPDPESCAVIQFTSGSSSQPRGVALTHRNILANLAQIHRAFDFRPDRRDEGVALWLPHFHDMGLVARLQCLWAGCAGHLMSPLEFTRRPLRWLELMSQTRATVSGGPNFAYDLCVETITAEERRRLDLSAWRVAFCGSEPIRAGTLDAFADAFAECGLKRGAMTPCYGLAEATLMVSCAPPERPFETVRLDSESLERGSVAEAAGDKERVLVGCGPAGGGIAVEIVAPDTGRAQPPGEIGEIWIRGPNVSAGYWGLGAQNAELFDAKLTGREDEGGYFRTGDLGFVRAGQLYVAGRLKELIIVNGRNLHPGDIEGAVRDAHPALRSARAAVFAADTGAGERPVVLYEVPRALRADRRLLDETLSAVLNRVAGEFEVEPARVVCVRRGGIALTTSGKVARQACREALAEGGLEVFAEWPAARPAHAAPSDNPTEQVIARLFEEVLGRPCADTSRPLRDFGGDSIMAVRLLARIRDTFGVSPEEEALAGASIGALAEAVDDLLVRKVGAMSEDEAAAMLAALEGGSSARARPSASEG